MWSLGSINYGPYVFCGLWTVLALGSIGSVVYELYRFWAVWVLWVLDSEFSMCIDYFRRIWISFSVNLRLPNSP